MMEEDQGMKMSCTSSSNIGGGGGYNYNNGNTNPNNNNNNHPMNNFNFFIPSNQPFNNSQLSSSSSLGLHKSLFTTFPSSSSSSLLPSSSSTTDQDHHHHQDHAAAAAAALATISNLAAGTSTQPSSFFLSSYNSTSPKLITREDQEEEDDDEDDLPRSYTEIHTSTGHDQSPSLQRSNAYLWAWPGSEGKDKESMMMMMCSSNKLKNNENVNSTQDHHHHHAHDSSPLGVHHVKNMKKMKVGGLGAGRKKIREPRFCFKTMSDVDVLDDGYKWRKYGQKVVKNTLHPRSYYRCTQDNCRVKKRVERLAEDPRMVITTYEGRHAHSPSHDLDESQNQPQITNFFW